MPSAIVRRMDVRIYHNPQCSKSRATLALLREHGLEPQVVLYLEVPPSSDELLELASKLAGEASKLVRTQEQAYAESGLRADSSLLEIVSAIAAAPSLLERPIVVVGERAAIGRPPE